MKSKQVPNENDLVLCRMVRKVLVVSLSVLPESRTVIAQDQMKYYYVGSIRVIMETMYVLIIFHDGWRV